MRDLFDRRAPDTARFSACGTYRYNLTRELVDIDGNPKPLVICGLNPSTATADDDDRTIARESDFAIRWGCHRLVKVNAYAFIDKSPKVMFAAKKRGVDIIGPENDAAIRAAAELCRTAGGIFLVAWGRNVEPERQYALAEMLGEIVPLTCVKTNGDGTPTHPLYQPKTLTPVCWVPPLRPLENA